MCRSWNPNPESKILSQNPKLLFLPGHPANFFLVLNDQTFTNLGLFSVQAFFMILFFEYSSVKEIAMAQGS